VINQDALKQKAAQDAAERVKTHSVIGVGTGSTVKYFIECLAQRKTSIDMTVASSQKTADVLKQHGLPVVDLNYVGTLPVYVDGADEIDLHHRMIKGGGGALTREKILANASKTFICMVDPSKRVPVLGKFPVAVEVIPMARGLVARRLLTLNADPVYREHFITDNGNIILDVHNLDLTDPVRMEDTLKLIPGVVDSGIFAHRKADIICGAE
jgi:ribose 5-phosphate isomerase A